MDCSREIISEVLGRWWDFPDCSVGKESACNAEDPGLVLGLGRSPGEGNNYPLQHSGLENSMDCIVHGVSKSWTHIYYQEQDTIEAAEHPHAKNDISGFDP